jgi:poly(ADP-ribose) glycohydrolase
LDNEFVSYARRAIPVLTPAFWETLNMPLQPVEVRTEGGIELDTGALQADFANEYLGGGVLHGGNVQEEIRFSVCPECLVGMLFCEKMLAHEAIFIVGAQQYSHYRGYGRSFAFDKPCLVREPLDEHRRPSVTIVAFDALVFPGEKQYGKEMILRELQKAYVACLGDLSEDLESLREMPPPFATGNWGCGVFGGDPQLKSLLQWIAASACKRSTHY